MIGPEVMRAFAEWSRAQEGVPYSQGAGCYPLYIGAAHNGRWYVRERMPGTRVWRAEEDGGFTLLDREHFCERLERIAKDASSC